jgi:PhnB protein
MAEDTSAVPALSIILAVPSGPEAVAWYRLALGAEVLWDLGGVAGMSYQGSAFFLHEPVTGKFATPRQLGATSARIELFVDDPDAVIAQAVAQGAIGEAPVDYEVSWGVHRQGGFTDPFGHVWLVGDRTPLQRYAN